MDSATFQNLNVAWTTPVFGVDGQLLYFGPLLNKLSEQFGEFAVYTGEYAGSHHDTAYRVERCGKYRRLYKNERRKMIDKEHYEKGISVSTPAVFFRLLKNKPDLLIINEFSIFSLYAALAKHLIPCCRVLCVVETKPRINQSKVTRYLRLLLRRYIASMSDAFLTNNIAGLDYLVKELGVNAGKIIAKPYLVSNMAENFQSQTIKEVSREKGRVHFLYIGQLVNRKGVHQAIKACHILSRQYANEFILDIVGDGPNRKNLESLVGEYKLGKNIIFHGRKTHDELLKYYSNSDVFLFPTLGDYRALTPFEALSFGLPILASIHDGGITETVVEGENGFSFDARNTEEIASKMAVLITDQDKISDFSIKSREMAQAYTLDSAVDAILEACSSAIKRPLPVNASQAN